MGKIGDRSDTALFEASPKCPRLVSSEGSFEEAADFGAALAARHPPKREVQRHIGQGFPILFKGFSKGFLSFF